MATVTRQQAKDMAQAHAEGLHADAPREFCPECEGRDIATYPLATGTVRDAVEASAQSAQWFASLQWLRDEGSIEDVLSCPVDTECGHAIAQLIKTADPLLAMISEPDHQRFVRNAVVREAAVILFG